MDAVTIWDVIQAVVIPLVVVIYVALSRKIDFAEKRADKAQDDLTEFRIQVAQEYTTKSALETTIRSLFDQFKERIDRLERKLDQHWKSDGN